MVKFNRKKIRTKKEKTPKEEKTGFSIWDLCANIIVAADEILDEAEEILHDGKDGIWNVTAAAVVGYDKLADLVSWAAWRTFVSFARNAHDTRIRILEHRKSILKHSAIGLVVLVGMVAIYASSTDYEYSYNGRALGIVSEQRDVLEILDLISEELSHEYGSNISIDADTDITFRPVISIGKEIDDADTVLKRFTYMGDIQAQAYAIVVDGELIATVESQKIAEEVLQSIKDIYAKTGSGKKYEEVSFKEEVKIQSYDTTLAGISSKNATIKKIKSGRQQESTYKVKSGDTLWDVAKKYYTTIEKIMDTNKLASENIMPGLKLLITR